MNNDDPRPERDAAPAAADLASTDGLLERCKRASLGRQALCAAWQLGALVRRVEHEAPEVHRQLRDAVEVLRLLGEQHALEHAGDRVPRPTAEPGPRQGELF